VQHSFLLFNTFVSFYLSRFSFYINIGKSKDIKTKYEKEQDPISG
jgi:hypothetical protein